MTAAETLFKAKEKTYETTIAAMKTIVANYQLKVDDYVEEYPFDVSEYHTLVE
jgi:hypothetical protein